MSLITLLVLLIVLGVVGYVITAYIPMSAGIKNIIIVVIILVALYYVLNAFGVFGQLRGVQVPQVR